MITKICTDIEQSKKLTELGIDINTADIIYNIFDKSYIRHDTPIDKYHMPAWSLTALLELIPKEQHTTLILNAHYKWVCDISNPGSFTYEPTSGDNPLDAVFEMILELHRLKML